MAQAPKNISKKAIALDKVKQLSDVKDTNAEKPIGVTKEQIQEVIETEFRQVRKNSAGQIISYTIPRKGPQASTLEYGKVLLPGVRNNLNKNQYNRVIDIDIEEFTTSINEFDIDTKKLNSVFFPSADIEAVLEEEPLNFNGELVRVGSGPSTIFYIEGGKFYTFAPGNGYLWHIIAERLGKPMGFRMNDEFDYSNEDNFSNGVEVDNGQNQYKIYNDNSYSRASIAYLETNQYGGELTKTKVLGIAAEETLYLKWDNKTTLDKFQKIQVIGKDSTPIQWNRGRDKPIRECFSSTEEDLKVGVFFESPLSVTFSFKLFYKNGGNIVLNPNKGTGKTWDNKTFDEYTITADNLKDDSGNLLWKVEIDTESRWAPFYQQGTSAGQLRFLGGVTVTATMSDGTVATNQNARAGYGAPLYKWTESGGGSWNQAGSTETNQVPLTVEGETYKWNGNFFEAYTPALGPTNEIKMDYQMLDGNLIALYGNGGDMQGGDKLVQDLWQAAQKTLPPNNIIMGYQQTKRKQRWLDKIQRNSSGQDETKLIDVLTQTADDINKGGTGYLPGNPFANVNLNFFTDPTSYDCDVSYDDLVDNYNLLTSLNSLVQTNPIGGTRDLKQAWELGDGSNAFGGSRVRDDEKSSNRAKRVRKASVWKQCIKKRAGGREEEDLLRTLGHTARSVIRSGNGRIQ